MGVAQEVSTALALPPLGRPSLSSTLTCQWLLPVAADMVLTFAFRDGEDYYTVSTATGFNIPVSIAPQYPPGNCKY